MNEQYHPETTKKRKPRLPVSAYLSYLLIATLLFTGISFSKFASTGSADDSARVALVMLDGETATDPAYGTMDIMDGELKGTCPFYVTNADSEVALKYTITITLPGELPTGVTMQLLNTNALNSPLELTQSGNTYTYTSTFPAGTTEQHNYHLVFIGDADTVTGEHTINGIKISASAEQID